MILRSPFRDVTIPDLSLTEFVLGEAARYGDAPALIDAATGEVTSYAQLLASVDAVAAGFARRGLYPGTVVAHYAPNRPEYAIAFHGVARAGGVNTTVNPIWTADELGAQLRDSGARYLVTVPELLDKAVAAAAASAVEELFVYGEGDDRAAAFATLRQCPDAAPDVTIDPARDLVALPYSSGTTGLPKGVMLSHRNLVANLCQCAHDEATDKTPAQLRAERVVAVLPLFHIYGMSMVMNLTLLRGATVVTMPRFDLREFLRVVQDHRITRAWLVPPIVQLLVKDPLVDAYDLSSLELINSGAAPLSADLEVACGRRLGVRMTQGYGMTETSPVTHWVTDRRAGQMPGKIGPAVPNTECRIVDPESGADVARGELLIRGPQVMRGYLNNPEATADTIDADGWLHTGDIAIVDADGALQIVDRIKELIKFKGYQVAPAELEAVLLTHPAITDAAVVALPDDDAGEVPKAFVVSGEPLTAADVQAYVAARVAPYKELRAIEFIDAIPKSPSGKILRRQLVERVA